MELTALVTPSQRLLRLRQVLDLFPVSRSGWWRGVKNGRYPQPVRIGDRAVAWRESEIYALIASCPLFRGADGELA